jgi:hypothetical protein
VLAGAGMQTHYAARDVNKWSKFYSVVLNLGHVCCLGASECRLSIFSTYTFDWSKVLKDGAPVISKNLHGLKPVQNSKLIF